MTVESAAIVQMLLATGRASAFLFTSPPLGGGRVPALAKIGFAFVLAAVSLAGAPAAPVGASDFVLLLAKEIGVGYLLGWAVILAFAAVEHQFGFAAGALVDPMHGSHGSVVGQMYAWLATVVFFAADAHHLFVRLFSRSFDLVPTSATLPVAGTVSGAVRLFGTAFAWGIQLAAPLLIAGLLVEAGLGLVARAAPQINVFIVSLPLKIGAGILLIGLFLPVHLTGIGALFHEAARDTMRILQGVRP
jgi:flagellar biosynthetic protein FliR